MQRAEIDPAAMRHVRPDMRIVQELGAGEHRVDDILRARRMAVRVGQPVIEPAARVGDRAVLRALRHLLQRIEKSADRLLCLFVVNRRLA